MYNAKQRFENKNGNTEVKETEEVKKKRNRTKKGNFVHRLEDNIPSVKIIFQYSRYRLQERAIVPKL